MKKMLIVSLFALVLISSVALADNGMMDYMMGYNYFGGYGMMGMFGMGLLGLVYIAIASFVFSIIFWLMYKWIVKGKK